MLALTLALPRPQMAVPGGGGGGGGSPTMLWSADFKNGIYSGGSIATLADVLTQDATNWGNFNAGTAVVAGVGLKPVGVSHTDPVLAAPARDAVLGGATFVFFCRPDAPGSSVIDQGVEMELFDAPDFTGERSFSCRFQSADWPAGQFATLRYPSGNATHNACPVEDGSLFKIAVTLTPSKAAISVKGATADELLNQTGWDTPPNEVGFTIYKTVEKIVAYAAVDNATLATLSA